MDEDTFKHFQVPIPAIREQERILERIGKHVEKMENAKREIKRQEDEIMSIIDGIVGGNQ